MDHIYAIFGGKSSNPFVRLQASANFFRLRPPPFYRLRPPPPHLIMGLILSMCILLDHWPFLITACSVWNWKVSAICANGKWQNSRDEAMFLISLLYVPVFAPLRNPRVLLFSYVYVHLIIITSPGTNILFAFSRGRGIAAPTSTSQDHQQEFQGQPPKASHPPKAKTHTCIHTHTRRRPEEHKDD